MPTQILRHPVDRDHRAIRRVARDPRRAIAHHLRAHPGEQPVRPDQGPANDPLAGPELENLVADLRRCRMPYTCPHGRPTLIEMSLKELEKKFGRVQ